MIPKSGNRFSDKIMRKQLTAARPAGLGCHIKKCENALDRGREK
jgi:hypothetical protein